MGTLGPYFYWGERSEPHTCGENGKLSIYMYICLVRTYSVYIHPAPFVRDAIFPCCMLVHCCSRDKTSKTERLNSGHQRNRDLKTARKGRHD